MHAVIRSYSGAGSKELFDLLEANKTKVEELMRAVPGFVSYSLLRTADGGAAVTVCEDKSGADESVRMARDWVQKNAAAIKTNLPSISEGAIILQLS